MDKKKIKKSIASSNINFLIGAGVSTPCLEILADIEKRLHKAESSGDTEEEIQIKREYFNKSILNNVNLINLSKKDSSSECLKVLERYKKFYKTINSLILKRESSLLSKQINIFTTNIDVFSEVALEKTEIEFNDGFHGRFNPVYNTGNFKKSYYKTSLHYEKTSEIPVFNVVKLHGSVSWKQENKSVQLDRSLQLVNKTNNSKNDKQFKNSYDKLMIINPSKKKFEDTVLNQTYYDLLRIYSNELEKENSILFVMGFSFADEHIKELTLRAANTNPTNIVYIFVYDDKKQLFKKLKNRSKNNNIHLINDSEYDLKAINKFFSELDEKQNDNSEDEE